MRYVVDIWHSFRALPGWVQAWVALVLVPVNAVSLAFLDRIEGPLVAALALGAILLNGVPLLVERGFSKAMAIPHVLLWTPLVAGIAAYAVRGDLPPGGFGRYLVLLGAVNAVSLAFDFRDARAWLRGDRAVAGR